MATVIHEILTIEKRFPEPYVSCIPHEYSLIFTLSYFPFLNLSTDYSFLAPIFNLAHASKSAVWEIMVSLLPTHVLHFDHVQLSHDIHALTYVIRIQHEGLPGWYCGCHRTVGFFPQGNPSPPAISRITHAMHRYCPFRLRCWVRGWLMLAILTSMLPVIPQSTGYTPSNTFPTLCILSRGRIRIITDYRCLRCCHPCPSCRCTREVTK